jgi:cytidine deaminase
VLSEKHYRVYRNRKRELVRRSRAAGENADQYRKFKVGCALLVWRPGRKGGKYEVYTAANVMPSKDGHKVCAEQTAACSAQSNGWELAVAFVITAQPQVDEMSGIKSKALPPCWICRSFLPTMRMVKPDTIVLMVANHSGEVIEMTMQEVIDQYERRQDA